MGIKEDPEGEQGSIVEDPDAPSEKSKETTKNVLDISGFNS